MVSGWIASWVSLLLYYVLLYCCCSTGLWVGESVRSCDVLLWCVHTGSWVIFIFDIFSPAILAPRWHTVQRTAITGIHSN